MQSRLDERVLIQRYVDLVRELGAVPVVGELRRKAKSDPTFPSHTVFARFGGKAKLLKAVLSFCRENSGYDDVTEICEPVANVRADRGVARRLAKVATGFVYLMKSGRHYKIGRTNALGRREWELGIKVPIPPRTIHSIETDDPVGIEAYWHRRFADKRGEGEWFLLTPEDVEAFKRWKRIV